MSLTARVSFQFIWPRHMLTGAEGSGDQGRGDSYRKLWGVCVFVGYRGVWGE